MRICNSELLWWTGRDLNPRPSGVLASASACKPDVLRPDTCQYTRLNYRSTGSRGFSVGLLSLVCGAAAGTFTPCWGGLNPASRLHWPRLSWAFQACTLPSYVTAATTAALWLSGICRFSTRSDRVALEESVLGAFFALFWSHL